MAAVQLAAQHEAGADAGADGEEREVVHPGRDALASARRAAARLTSFSSAHGWPSRSRSSSPIARVPRPPTPPASSIVPLARRTTPGHADHDAVERRAVDAARRDQRSRAGSTTRSSTRVDVGVAHLDVLPRPDLARQVADRAAQVAAADVEAEHQRRLVHGLEEDRAVARAARVVGDLAHQPRVDQARSAIETVGLEMPARRETSAREIGAAARIVSSTAAR